MSSASAFFRGMFNNECSETIESKVQLDFHNETLNDVIDYVYSGIIKMTNSNIEHVIEISRYFLVCSNQMFNLYIYIYNIYIY